MCAIGGCYKKDGITASDLHEIIEMAKRGVCRGRDATGFMIPNGWWKIAERSPIAVERTGFMDWLESNNVWDGDHQWVMFHTRAKTRGNPRVSSNNHPLVHGRDEHGVKLIHNGVIKTPNYFGYDVVDTRSLIYLINKLRMGGMSLLEATRSTIVSVTGRAAVVSIDRYGKEFVIMKDANDGGSPVHYYWNKSEDRLQFSSTKEINGDCYIGIVGKKNGTVTEFELGHYQALWWNGEQDTPLVRVWDKEKHGGRLGFTRMKLPDKLDLKDFRPKDYEDGGKFSLNYNNRSYGYRSYSGQNRSQKRQKNRYRDNQRGKDDYHWGDESPIIDQSSLYDYIPVSDRYDNIPLSRNVIYPTTVPYIGENEGKSWYNFSDEKWATKLRAELIKLEKVGLFSAILRYDEENNIMWIILSDNTTRKYFRTKKKKKLAYVEY